MIFSLSDCIVPASEVTSCLRGVQSYVCSSEFKVGSFFTQRTMECVRDAISGARIFMVSGSDFDPWDRVCVGDRAVFIERYSSLFEAHLCQKKEESYQRFRLANQRVVSGTLAASCSSTFPASSGGRPARSSLDVTKGSKASAKRPMQQSVKPVNSEPSPAKGGKKKPKKQSSSAPSPRK